MLYDHQGSGIDKSNISQGDINLIQKHITLSNEDKFTFQTEFKKIYDNFYKPYPSYNKDFLISVVSIKQNDELVGYFVVATPKIQNN